MEQEWFCIKIVGNIDHRGEECKMIQLINISQNLQRDISFNNKVFAHSFNENVKEKIMTRVEDVAHKISLIQKEMEQLQSSMKEEATPRTTLMLSNLKLLKETVDIDTRELQYNTQNLLDITQIKLGIFHKKIEVVEVLEVLKDVISAHKLNAQKKNIRFEIVGSSETA